MVFLKIKPPDYETSGRRAVIHKSRGTVHGREKLVRNLCDVLQSDILRAPMLILQMFQAVTHRTLPTASTAMPETSGRRAVIHKSRGTVHGREKLVRNLCDVLQSDILRAPMLILQMFQALTHRTLPNSTPLHRAPPQLSQLQMEVHHVDVQGKCDLLLTDREKSRSIMDRKAHSGRRRADRRSRSTSFDRRRIIQKTAFGHRRGREVISPGEICRERQVGDAARFSTRLSWKPSVASFESGNINRSSHGNDPGSIRVSGLVLSKARRPNASCESDNSRSTSLENTSP